MVAPLCRGKAKCPSSTCGHSYVTDGVTEQRWSRRWRDPCVREL